EPQISGPILNAVKVAGDFSFGRQNHDAARMRKLFRLFIPKVTKSDGISQTPDVCFVSGQKMPGCFASRAVVSLDVGLFFGGSDGGRIARVKADVDHFELLAGVE